jgi:hypothetical protein
MGDCLNAKPQASWLWVPPETPSVIDPPVVHRVHELPLNRLSWPDFQRICARLALREEDVEFAQEYGTPGQEQDGIDIYICKRLRAKYVVWQCKRHQDAAASVVSNAVDEFLKGAWSSKTEEFGLCITCHTEDKTLADEIEKQRTRLDAKGIAFTPLGITQLSARLKTAPDIVDDFFEREWVKRFCGEEAATQLGGRRLRPSQIAEFRKLLHQCYIQHFESVDPGLPYLTSPFNRGPAPFPLIERYVLADILELRERTDAIADQGRVDPGRLSSEPIPRQTPDAEPGPRRTDPTRIVTTSQDIRRPALTWLAEGEQSVVLGDPGCGKSAFLRYVALDLLSAEPNHRELAIKWGHLLPVWVPFAMWVRLVAENETSCSLATLLRGWLAKVSAPNALHELVVQALDDSRLLLLVDGLDEWTNETAARTTVALLEQFVGERSIPAIATCRPLGFQRLGGLSSRWRRGHLAGMTHHQQADLAKRWFLHRQRALASGGDMTETDIERYADSHSRRLMDDIRRDGQLARLAETPLLLSGLIALAAQQVQLPCSRFRAYEELTSLLLQEHPRRREKAAHSRQPSMRISDETRQRALACLAYETHRATDSGSLGREVARDVLRDFFAESLCKSPSEAFDLAEDMIAVGAESIGILVEKAHDEIGFLHRTFQEFLAACHLRRMPFSAQREHTPLFVSQPAWQNVFLCLCHLNERADENDQLVQAVESLAVPPEAEVVRTALLAEFTFAGLHCTPATTMRLANRAFREIEHGSWMPLRRRVLEYALNGFHSDVLQSTVKSRFRGWYPARHTYRSGAFEALGNWPQEDATTEVLLRGLRDEEEWTQRAAAEALPKYAGGDPAIQDHLLAILAESGEPRVLAYALHALCLGWPKCAKIPPWLNAARHSGDTTVEVIAAYHRVQRNEADETDRAYLLRVGDWHSHGLYHWREDAARALAKGWPHDAAIKALALETLKDGFAPYRRLDREFAGAYLFNACPQDDQVAKVIAHLFRTETYPSHSFGIGGRWHGLIQSFAGHPLLRDVVDDWFEKHGKTLDDDVCLVSHSDRAKQALLGLSNKPSLWTTSPIRTLVAGWGVEDQEVRSLLTTLGHDSEVSPYVADLLPLVISDKEECRRLLLAHLREQPEDVAYLALAGLVTVGCREEDADVVDAALRHWGDKIPCGLSWTGVSILVRGFSKHPEVRKLAALQIHNRGGNVAVVAASYRDDADMRAQLLAALTPLPSALRLHLVDWLERQAFEGDFALDHLAQFDQDTGQEVKTAAAIAYARTVQARGYGLEQLLDSLLEISRAVGSDYHERRQAALAGLLELQHAEVIAGARETYDENKPLSVDLGGSLHPNMRLARQVANHWEHIDKTFGNSFWDRTDWIPDEMLEEMASTTESPRLRHDILERLSARMNRRELNVAALDLLSEELRGTDELRDRCLQLVRECFPNTYVDTAPGIRAAEILGRQFRTDASVLKEMEELIGKAPNPSAAVIALCEGWPRSDSLRSVDPKADRERKLLVPAQVCLMATLASPEDFVETLGRGLRTLTGNIWDFLPLCVRAVQKRFEADGTVKDLAFSRLESSPTPSEMLVFSSMLQRTDSRIQRLRAICSSELSRQRSSKQLPDLALDITAGVVRPVAHVLLDILAPIG